MPLKISKLSALKFRSFDHQDFARIYIPLTGTHETPSMAEKSVRTYFKLLEKKIKPLG